MGFQDEGSLWGDGKLYFLLLATLLRVLLPCGRERHVQGINPPLQTSQQPSRDLLPTLVTPSANTSSCFPSPISSPAPGSWRFVEFTLGQKPTENSGSGYTCMSCPVLMHLIFEHLWFCSWEVSLPSVAGGPFLAMVIMHHIVH